MKIRVLSEDVVKPASPTLHGRLELSPIDQVSPRFHGPPILAFAPTLPPGM
jgi:hypothetical protein